MPMQTAHFKEQERSVHNSIGKMPSVQSVSWWSSIDPQSAYEEPYRQLKSISMEHPTSGNQFSSTKHQGHGAQQGMNKGDSTHFTIFSGNLLPFV